MVVVYLGVCWLVGIWVASLFSVAPSVLAVGGVSLILPAVWLRHRRVGLVLAGCASLCLGGARYGVAQPLIDENHIAYYNEAGGDVGLLGVVGKEPDVRDQYVNLHVAVQRLTLADGTSRPVQGQVLVRANRFPVIPYGAQVAVNGRLQTPPEDETFSYKDYLARQGVYSIMSQARVEILAEGMGSPLLQAIFAVKQKAQAAINHLIPDPEAALLSGILLGNDNGIPPDLAEDFRTTGLTHIIAISGFNIAILIAILISLVDPFLPRRTAVLVAVIGVILYTILVGADASVVRAAIMGSIFLFTSRWLGRPNYAFASLFFAGFVMTLLNPMTFWDVGFQLSFMATLGLMLYADPFTRWTRRQLTRVVDRPVSNQIMGILSEAVLLTMAAQILTLPLMIAYFRQLSLISLAANALVLPIQPGVMIWGGAATLAGMVWTTLGQPLAWVAWLFLTATIRLVRAFAAVPGASIALNVPPLAIVVLYGIIGAVTWLAKVEPERRTAVTAFLRQNVSQRLALGGSLVALLLVGGWSFSQPDGRLHVTFFDVGQGDAIFIQTPSGRQILVDGGYYPSVLNDQLGRRLPFWDREIDLLVATHPDADHVAGLAGVLARYAVARLLTDGEGLGESAIYDAVLLAAEAQKTEIMAAQAGQVIAIDDGVQLEVLNPGRELEAGERNNNSVVLRLVYGDFSLLLTGDAEADAETRLMTGGLPVTAVVLKAGHHGSKSSSSPAFMSAVQPRIVIISAGADNKFGHPSPEVLARAQAVGAAVLRTDELGSIEVTTDGETMWWRAGPK